MACIGYCFNLQKWHSAAIPWYKKALDAKCSTAGVHNNLAVSYELGIDQHSFLKRLQLAGTHIEKALELAPASEIVGFNGASFESLRFLNDSHYVPNKGLDLIRSLIKKNPDHPELYFTAAWLYAAVAQSSPAIVDDAIALLLDACSRDVGIDVEKICNKPDMQILREHPRFAELQRVASRQSKKSQSKSILRFIDPIE